MIIFRHVDSWILCSKPIGGLSWPEVTYNNIIGTGHLVSTQELAKLKKNDKTLTKCGVKAPPGRDGIFNVDWRRVRACTFNMTYEWRHVKVLQSTSTAREPIPCTDTVAMRACR